MLVCVIVDAYGSDRWGDLGGGALGNPGSQPLGQNLTRKVIICEETKAVIEAHDPALTRREAGDQADKVDLYATDAGWASEILEIETLI